MAAQRWRLCRRILSFAAARSANSTVLDIHSNALRTSLLQSAPVRSVHCTKQAGMRQAGVHVKANSHEASSHEAQVGKRVSSNRYLKVLGTGGSDTPPCVYLFTDSQRYMFNCGDNIERFCLEHKLRVSRLRNVFLTRTQWDCVGGLPGLVMHMRDSSLDELTLNLHGPQELVGYDRAVGYVVNKTKLHFNLNVLSESCAIMYKDDEIQVTGILLEAGDNGNSSSSDDEDVMLERGEPSTKRSKRERSSLGSVVYLCELSDIPGKFDRGKAQALGLPSGPLYAKLVQGNSVTAPSGREVKPSDVLGPTFVGPLFVIVDCPNEQALAALLANKHLQGLHEKDCSKRPSLVIHMTPREVAEREEYVLWVNNFGPSTQHLFLHSTICPKEHVFRANLKIQAPLNSIFPDVFSVPGKEGAQPSLRLPPVLEKQARCGQVMLMHHFYPSKAESWDESELFSSIDECYKEHMKAFEENKTLKLKTEDKLKEIARKHQGQKDRGSDGKGVTVTFLGTGASLPSRYRNVSSTLLQLTSGSCLLLDCGEGTLQQLYNCFGTEEACAIIQRLGCVFVSHIHGDHNLGLIRLLKHRYKLLKHHEGKYPLIPLIFGPFALSKMLWEYSNHCERLFYQFIPNLKCNSDCEGVPDVIAAAAEMGLKELKPVYVKHCYDSHGLAVTDASTGHRVIFSGDTRPSCKLSEFGKGAKLLIHEGTFEDDLHEEAVAKKHCTVSEALEVAKQMEAEHVVLTHFSQRYPKVPAGMLTGCYAGLQVGLAFDCMHVHLDHMDHLYDVMPVVRDVLAELIDDTEQPSHSVQLTSWD